MCRELPLLKGSAISLVEKPHSLDFRNRTRIERCIFAVAKYLARQYLKHDLSGLSMRERETVEQLQMISGIGPEVFDVLFLAFELNSVLRTLAIGKAYDIDDLLGASLPGRKNAVQAFARRLDRFAEAVSAIL